jgi:hypothetical protein
VVDEADEESAECKQQGWISSLFVNNPDIPAFAHRVVKPVAEPVFSSQEFKDLPIHPFTVSAAPCCILQAQSVREGRTVGTFCVVIVLGLQQTVA